VSGDAEVIDSGRVYGRACIGGNAKIQDNPRIYGTAVVRGHAIVRGDSRVYGHAIVRDKAQVEDAIITGEAQMRGDAFAEGCTIKHDILALTGTYIKSPLYVCGSKESLYMSGPNLLTLGGLICDTRSLAEWSYHLTTILKEYYYNREEINEYVEYFKMFQKFGNEAFRKE
jgi:NDP-sugar pyrophosphorylase family protein